MILQKRIFAVALSLVPTLCVPAFCDEITIVNRSDKTIYHVYAWPSDFPPRSSNLIISPLHSQEITSIEIRNSYDDCKFTFMIDTNLPSILKGNKPKKKKVMDFDYHNICTEKKPIKILEKTDQDIN